MFCLVKEVAPGQGPLLCKPKNKHLRMQSLLGRPFFISDFMDAKPGVADGQLPLDQCTGSVRHRRYTCRPFHWM